MKKIMVMVSLLLLMVAGVVQAQTTPITDAREHEQRARIRQGVASGNVTHHEAARLRAEQRHIHRTERRAKADGEITSNERARLKRQQHHASRDIRRQKLDGQNRPRAK
jgi:hypothetical protein